MQIGKREQQILDSLLEEDFISVADLSRDLLVSEVTIRTDLKNMERQGLLSRVHGGAIPSVHPHILERQNLHVKEKQLIAKAAAALVQNGDTIMIEAGTTPAMICRYLSGYRDIHVITNSILAFNAAKNDPFLRVTLCGGEYYSNTESFLGPIAVEAIQRFNVRIAFVGTDGFSAKSGITTSLIEGCEVIKMMREQARQLILVTDSTKYKRIGPVTIMPLAGVDGIITDSQIVPEAAEEMREDAHIQKINEERDQTVTRYWFDTEKE
jgi:DeoR family galactitol utilization operon repressor